MVVPFDDVVELWDVVEAFKEDEDVVPLVVVCNVVEVLEVRRVDVDVDLEELRDVLEIFDVLLGLVELEDL